MAKTPRRTMQPLPLSEAFYAALTRVGRHFDLNLDDRHALSSAVAALSQTYTRDRSRLSTGRLGADAPLARLGFFLPRDLVKLFGPLGELSRAGRLPPRTVWRVLDVGAGLGSTSLGLARFLRHDAQPVSELRVHAVERDPMASQLMAALCLALAPLSSEFAPIHLERVGADARHLKAQGPYDLVLLGLVLNELFLERSAAERAEAQAAFIRHLGQNLAPDGAIVILEPALRESARELMQLRDLLCRDRGELSVFAPCVHDAPCPMLPRDRDWCHEALDFALPASLIPVARAAGLRYEGLQYAALVLTKTPRFPAEESLQRVVSEPLRSKGKLELFGCSRDGYQRLTRLDRDRSAQNAAFDGLRRGHVVELDATRITKESVVRRR